MAITIGKVAEAVLCTDVPPRACKVKLISKAFVITKFSANET